MTRKFVNLDWQKINEFAQVFHYDNETARDVLTYIVEHNIIYSWLPDEFTDDELQEAYEEGWAAACEEMPSAYDAPTYHRPRKGR